MYSRHNYSFLLKLTKEFIIITLVIFIFIKNIHCQDIGNFNKSFLIGLSYNSIQGQFSFYDNPAIQLNSNGDLISGGNIRNKSYSTSIITGLRINEKTCLRMELGFTKINSNSFDEYYQNGNLLLANRNINFNIYRISPNLLFSITNNKSINYYVTGGLIYNIYEDYYFNLTGNIIDSLTGNLVVESIETWNIEGGFSTGITIGNGFNIKLLNNIYFGSELSFSLSYLNYGGTYSMDIYQKSLQSTLHRINTTQYTNNGIKTSDLYITLYLVYQFINK